ncbi:hypothetical protein C2S53_010003 [Perilla frutescens var. hirtella]|uniref:Homeobox domain-containing protein n=1 Tax=Perilla frutescens var. hirtella TaxID=608512 RepID=A0AAD4NWH8_PERFH|nr:hypothetical protein C2S53_010003 [Perilla frutescens var. hirtella]
MELGLSLQPFSLIESSQKIIGTADLGFCMAVGKMCGDGQNYSRCKETGSYEDQTTTSSSEQPVQLDLLPFSPVHRYQPSSNNFPFTTNTLTQNLLSKEKLAEEGPSHSSPNSTISSFQMEFFSKRGRCDDEEAQNYSSPRKKLRLSKQQSAFLELSFKQHSTLNPKEKVALAKRLSLRPRQVEVWFQNRRARTKLKQMEVDCEYLNKCCETLRDDNRRLQKEIQELRALINASKSLCMQLLPPTTLIMCPSCERVATNESS